MSLKVSLLVSSLALMVPALGFSATVSLNSICVTPNCLSPDVLNSGGSTGSSLNTIWTLPNGDQYYLSGFYGASYTPGNPGSVNIAADPAAQYIGNITNHNAMSQNDILTFNFYQNYNFTGDPSGYYAYYAQSITSGTLGAGSSYTINASWNGIQIGPSTYGTGYSGTNLFNQRYYTTSELSATPLAADEFISMYFAAGSDPGASFTTITPEPGSMLLLSLGGLVLLGFAVKNARQRNDAVPVP